MANYTGTNGVDNYTGTNSGDTISGLGGNDILAGLGGQDTIDGGSGDDSLFGGAGNDTLIGGAGNDTIDGEADNGFDYASYSTATSRVEVSLLLAGSAQNTLGAGLDTLLNIEGLIGSSYNDVLTGTDGADRLNGGAGDDLLQAGGGNDFVYDVSGDDILHGGAGADRMSYTNALAGVVVDLSRQGQVQNTVGAGLDLLTGFEGVNGSAYADVLTGDGAANDVYGLAGNDVLNGGGGDDMMGGGAGNDILDGGDGIDTYIGDNNLSYRVDLRLQGAAQDTGEGMDTLSGFENLIGGMYDDVLTGDDGDNVIDGWFGSDVLAGGLGVDTVTFHLEEAVIVDLAGGVAYTTDLYGDPATDTLSGFENAEGGSYDDQLAGDGGANVLSGLDGHDTLTGEGGADTLKGGNGNDTLFGDGGDDVLEGGAGIDWLYGGAGIDLADYGAAASAVSVSLALGDAQQDTGGAGIDSLAGIENLRGSAFDDSLTGDQAANRLDGGAGDDALSGGLGDDVLLSGAGQDQIDGGAGTDRLVLGGAFADYAITRDGDVITLVDTRVGGDGVEIVTEVERFVFTDVELTAEQLFRVEVVGVADHLVITRGVQSALLASALLANDQVNYDNHVGSVSNAQGLTVTLAEGRLVMLATGESGAFDYTIEGPDGPVTVHVTVGTVPAGTAADTLTPGVIATGADLQGLTGNDVLTGSAGDDRLVGGQGNDRLTGGAGRNELIGGIGNDIYVLNGAGEDTIVELAGEGVDTVETTVDGHVLGGNLDNLVLLGGALSGVGNGLRNNIVGNAGNNVLDGGAGDDVMDGALGDDTYHVDSLLDVVRDSGGVDTVITTLSTYTLTSVAENLVFAGDGSFTGRGNANANTITGGSGDDHLYGAGNDTLIGGVGSDHYYVTTRTDEIVESFDDEVGVDVVHASVTYVLGDGFAIEELRASGDRAINLTGNLYVQNIVGNDAANVLDGGDYAFNFDRLEGLGGDDTYVFRYQEQIVEAANGGYDTVLVRAGYHQMAANVEKAVIQAGGYRVIGNDLANLIVGDSNANILNGGAGNDVLRGGAGDDGYFVDSAGDVIEDTAGTDTVTIGYAFGSYTLAAGLENAVSGSDVANTLRGNTAANVLTGGNGGDHVYGLGGNDRLYGDRDPEISGVVGADVLDGGAGNDELYGYAGDDHLIGGAGNDILAGGDGSDRLEGGLGDDTYVILYGDPDVIVEQPGGGIDTIQLRWAQSPYTMAAGVENLNTNTFAVVTGNASNNVMTTTASGVSGEFYGLGGDDTLILQTDQGDLYGGEGNDVLEGGDYQSGGAGNDQLRSSGGTVMEGGTGNDTYVVGRGSNSPTIVELAGEGTDTVMTYTTSFVLGANVERLTAMGSSLYGVGNELANVIKGSATFDILEGRGGNDQLYGYGGDDELLGGLGNDLLFGGEGDDDLFGGDGSDQLTGGAGRDELTGGGAVRDTFIFEAAADSAVGEQADRILDFDASDLIDLRKIDANTGLAADQAFALIGSAAFSGVAGQLRFETDGSRTNVFGDVNGDGVADFQIVLTGVHALNAGDFLL